MQASTTDFAVKPVWPAGVDVAGDSGAEKAGSPDTGALAGCRPFLRLCFFAGRIGAGWAAVPVSAGGAAGKVGLFPATNGRYVSGAAAERAGRWSGCCRYPGPVGVRMISIDRTRHERHM